MVKTPLNELRSENLQHRRSVIMLYENQRWWFMQGYTGSLFKLERSPWSDLTGEMTMEKKDAKLLGKDWQWEGEWKVQGREILRQESS